MGKSLLMARFFSPLSNYVPDWQNLFSPTSYKTGWSHTAALSSTLPDNTFYGASPNISIGNGYSSETASQTRTNVG